MFIFNRKKKDEAEQGGKSMREGTRSGVGRHERMKRGSGMEDRDERSRGIEIHIGDVFVIIKPTEPFKFLYAHRKDSILAGELPEESDQFRFLRTTHLVKFKVSVGLILDKDSSVIVITIPNDLSTRSFIPLTRFFNSRRPTPLLTPSLVILPYHSD